MNIQNIDLKIGKYYTALYYNQDRDKIIVKFIFRLDGIRDRESGHFKGLLYCQIGNYKSETSKFEFSNNSYEIEESDIADIYSLHDHFKIPLPKEEELEEVNKLEGDLSNSKLAKFLQL